MPVQQDQDIKGFSLLELLVVIVIIGVISAVGYPNFSKWRTDREVRVGAEKIFNLMNSIVTQTQRGYYPYVQVHVDFSNNPFSFISKGMSKDTFSSELNKGNSLDCSKTTPWDNTLINEFVADNIVLHFDDDGAVCFSKDGSYYELTGKLDSNINLIIEGRAKGKKDYIIICSAKDAVGKICPDTKNITRKQVAYMVEWSRFGSINKYKWDGSAWKRI